MTISQGSSSLKDGGQKGSKIKTNGLKLWDDKLKNVKVSDGCKD